MICLKLIDTKNLIFIKPLLFFYRLGLERGWKNMSDEDIRKLLQSYVENGTMDSETAKKLLERILNIIFNKDGNERRDRK